MKVCGVSVFVFDVQRGILRESEQFTLRHNMFTENVAEQTIANL